MLDAYVDAYLAQVAALTYDGLCARQRPPFASISTGAAGVAYALLRAGHLEPARRWAAEAWDARARPDACDDDGFVGGLGSVPCGVAGIAFVDALVAEATGDRARLAARMADLVAICAGADADPEHWQGAAGRLCALATLYGKTGDGAVGAAGDRIAAALPGSRLPAFGFAHGAAGALYAQLRWSGVRGGDPAHARAATARLADVQLGDDALARGWSHQVPRAGGATGRRSRSSA